MQACEYWTKGNIELIVDCGIVMKAARNKNYSNHILFICLLRSFPLNIKVQAEILLVILENSLFLHPCSLLQSQSGKIEFLSRLLFHSRVFKAQNKDAFINEYPMTS